MRRILLASAAILVLNFSAAGAVPAKTKPASGSTANGGSGSSSTSSAVRKKSSSKKTSKKKASTKRTSTKKASAKKALTKASRKTTSAKSKRRKRRIAARRVPKTPPVSRKARGEAKEAVDDDIEEGASLPVENAAALVPFFELLFRHQRGEIEGPLRILQYGDSHTAADEWTGDLRARFQSRFGDGGSGYSYAGRPWTGYRRMDVRTGSTRGWRSEGLVGHPGDGLYGLGGVSISTERPHESVYLVADCAQLEVFYLQQPEGGSMALYDNGSMVERISTSGEMGPGYYRYTATPGPHRFELETLERAPVRLFGLVAENETGVTYEALGINGAQASIVLDWDQSLLANNIERRNPSLIVLAYGTNEAGQRDWTKESYRDMFSKLIQRFREAAPTAAILVIGPPDRYYRSRGRWLPMDNVGTIVAAQREAALSNGCAFWDTRAKMGGKGAMREWVLAGMAQYDHVHFTAPGYKLLGDAIFRDLMGEYDTFLKVREQLAATAPAAN